MALAFQGSRATAAQKDARGHVPGVQLDHAPEGGLRVRPRVLGAAHQPEHVLGLRRLGQGPGGGAGLLLGRGQVVGEQQREGQVDARERQAGVGRQRRAEVRGGLLGPELLQQRHAAVVGAASLLVIDGRGRRRRCQRGEQHEARHQAARAQRASCKPVPSRSTTSRPAATSRAVSTRPPGQRTSRVATRRSAPRPKVSTRSLCDR